MAATGWKHAGYIMLLYLAGLKGIDPRCGRLQRWTGPARPGRSVVFKLMRPINIIILVVTVIEALRAFDIVWVINKGTNGLELIGTLVIANIISEADRLRLGPGHHHAGDLALVFITIFLSTVMRGEQR